MNPQHKCFLCRWRDIPTARPFCSACFDVVPWELRGRVLMAWRRRSIDYVKAQEVVAELNQWHIEFSGGGTRGHTQ